MATLYPPYATQSAADPEAVNHSPLALLRPRSVWDIVDDAIDLYRRRFALFAGIAACVYVPVYIVYIIAMSSALNAMTRAAQNKVDNSFNLLMSLFSISWLAIPLLAVAYLLQNGATTVAVNDYLHGRTTTIWSAFRRTLSQFWILLLAGIVYGFITMIGLCGLYIGAFLMMALFAFVPQAVIVERKGVFGAGQRSRDLCSLGYSSSLGLLLLCYLLIIILASGVQGVFTILLGLLPHPSDIAARETQDLILTQSVSSVIYLLTYPLLGIATTLLYYDLRVRREGLDMVAHAEEMGYPLAPDPFGGVANPRVPRAGQRRG